MVQGGCQMRLSGERSFLVFACEPMKSIVCAFTRFDYYRNDLLFFSFFLFPFFILLPARFPMQPTNVYQGSDHGSYPWLIMGSF